MAASDLEANSGSTDPDPGDAVRTGQRRLFPIVGIGASAGGLGAFESFFSMMPADSGMAFVLVQHLSPPAKSMLDDLIGRYTAMPVAEVTGEVEVEPNHIYIIPPGKDLALFDGSLQLIDPDVDGAVLLPLARGGSQGPGGVRRSVRHWKRRHHGASSNQGETWARHGSRTIDRRL